MTPEQENALHDAVDRRAGQLAALKRGGSVLGLCFSHITVWTHIV
jgi:hypothetical protein